MVGHPEMKNHVLCLCVCIFLLVGCSDMHGTHETLEDAVVVEAMCTASAEAFQLYKSSKRHMEHGLYYAQLIEYVNHNRNFRRLLRETRLVVQKEGQRYAATFFTTECDEKLTNQMYDQYIWP